MRIVMNAVYNMKKYIFIFAIIALVQCKDNDLPVENFAGRYQLDFTVTQRPALFWADMNPIFYTQSMYGYYLDLSQNVCCEPKPPTKAHGCPMEYSRNDFEIISINNEYYLKNRIIFNDEGDPINFDIPLFKEGNKLTLKNGLSSEQRFFLRNTYIGFDDYYPLYFELLELSFNLENNQIVSGIWKFIDLFGQKCYLKGSDEKYYQYMMVEFADFKATRL